MRAFADGEGELVGRSAGDARPKYDRTSGPADVEPHVDQWSFIGGDLDDFAGKGVEYRDTVRRVGGERHIARSDTGADRCSKWQSQMWDAQPPAGESEFAQPEAEIVARDGGANDGARLEAAGEGAKVQSTGDFFDRSLCHNSSVRDQHQVIREPDYFLHGMAHIDDRDA